MKPRIVITYPFPSETLRKELASFGRVVLSPHRSHWKRDLVSASALITQLYDRVDESVLGLAPGLKVVGNYAVGLDNIDLAACARRGVAVVNTPGVLSRATAELALTLLCAVARRVPEGEALCRRRRFSGWRADLLLGLELRGRRAVLVGRGRIGRETALLFEALGIEVEWITRRDSPRVIRSRLKRAQILSLHLPLTSETRHWLDASRIALLPPDAIVINTARGPIVDERALISALKSRRIFGAGLDVFEREPILPRALIRLPNVVVLPHLGSATRQAREAMARLVIDGVKAVLSGKQPPNRVGDRVPDGEHTE